ncbi:hypothetical protein M8C21_014269 [Ambrosia artemisiifolia]|uniref:Uncharacterized protein n=1 Tax=Ambrosia artemisiifolia TaxID=4212 RepID=A0AAD5GN54_AMBAR|nr:hypothetical protein M8C21_014269 [Ambrosia artemisiifolia]
MNNSRRRDTSTPPVSADLTGVIRQASEINSDSVFGNSAKGTSKTLHNLFYLVTAWTNEKHDLYLDHLESSFVKQLHRSILKNHPRGAGKQCFVRAPKVQDNSTTMNLCARDKNSFSNVAGLSTEQTFQGHGYFEEFSDQNFPDEASEQMCVTMSKRSKTIVS